jgi:ATP-dependent helicase/nuclease subunit B
VRVIGDLDEGEPPFEPGDIALDLPPAIGAARRRFELARLIFESGPLLDRRLTAAGALELADALGRFLDSWQIEELSDASAVAQLAGAEFAEHWRISAQFLALALEAWPVRLAELGLMDIAERRVRLLRLLARRWRAAPPEGPVIVAGSTGSAPATADLIAAAAGAPRGAVVLPGLDLALAEAAWARIEGIAGESHPQGALKRLLDRAGVPRSDVRPWDWAAETQRRGRWRRRLINEALRPAEVTSDWLGVIKTLEDEARALGEAALAEGLDGLSLTTVRDEDEAAGLAALLMRESLETPGQTCALVTPDGALARRVSARLFRWGLEAEVSAGEPLAHAPAGVLAGLVAGWAAAPAGDPVRLLAIAKHPLARLGLDPEVRRQGLRALERQGLRGPRPESFAALQGRLEEPAARELATRLAGALDLAARPFAEGEASASAAAAALTQALEALSEDAGGEVGALWSGEAGQALAALLAGVIDDSAALPPVSAAAFAELVGELLAGAALRPQGQGHPRLRILGVLEARLLGADRLILAGLEEGIWPSGAGVDPFLSRPMRQSLGLPPPERRIGLAAHDFAQAACAAEVALIECARRDGAPAVASRWLWRLRALAKGASVEIPARADALGWLRDLDAPLVDPPPGLQPAPRPRPTPPLATRPRRLPVTGVEQWIRDPYGLYARRILRLRPLDLPDAPVDARLRGTAIHRAMERFALVDVADNGASDQFVEIVLSALAEAGAARAQLARERALAANLAPWVVAFERRRRPGARLLLEAEGALVLQTPGGPFTLTAKADRIEVRDGAADILDFKTGRAPTAKMVAAGLSPQLTLTAAILANGGFEGVAARPSGLVYVQLSGGREPAREEDRGGEDAQALADVALAGLRRRIAHFDKVETPYVAWAAAQFVDDEGDYDHLARKWEWRVIGESAGSEGP